MNYRALQTFSFVLLILSTVFLFNACNKDTLIDDESIELRSDYSDLTGQNLEFYNWFNQMLNTHDYNNPDSIVSPFYFDIDWHSGSHFQYFGDNTLVYNINYNYENESLYSRLQIAISKNSESQYKAKMLFYRADSIFYTNNFIYPSIYNFHGIVLEVSDLRKGIDNLYLIEQDYIVKKLSHNELIELRNSNLTFRNNGPWPWISCWGDSEISNCISWLFSGLTEGISEAWKWVWSGVTGSNGGGDAGSGTGSGTGSGAGTGGWSGGWSGSWSGGNFGGRGGSSGSSNGSSGTGGTNPWNKPLNTKAYKCRMDNLEILQQLAPELFTNFIFWDPCTGESSQEYALDILCSQNDNEANLNDPEVLKNFVLKWKAKRAERVRDAADCSICDNAIENYEATYGVNLNEEQEAYILNNMTTCWRLSEFNCLTNKALFFQRSDIQQIIADNSLIDPCNPELTSKDILDNYANNNCRDNICTKPLDGVFSDIGEEHDIIIEDESFNEKTCSELICLYNLLLKSTNKFVCKNVAQTFDDPHFKLKIKVEDTGIGGGSAYSIYNSKSKSSTLIFDPFLCGKGIDEVTIMSTIIHEFVHIELMREMHNKGYNYNDINDWYKFFPDLANYIYDKAVQQGLDEVHHHLMIEYEKIIDKMATALFEIFNGAAYGLTIDHFKMKAAGGLFYAMEIHASNNPKFNTLYGAFLNKYDPLDKILKSKNLSLGCK